MKQRPRADEVVFYVMAGWVATCMFVFAPLIALDSVIAGTGTGKGVFLHHFDGFHGRRY